MLLKRAQFPEDELYEDGRDLILLETGNDQASGKLRGRTVRIWGATAGGRDENAPWSLRRREAEAGASR